MPHPFKPAKGPVSLNGAFLDVDDETGLARKYGPCVPIVLHQSQRFRRSEARAGLVFLEERCTFSPFILD